MHKRHSIRTAPIVLLLTLLALAVPPAGAQAPWPNLDTLDNYPNPAGTTCTLDGSGRPGSEKAATNRQKNRYTRPTSSFETVLLSDIMKLPSGTPNAPTRSTDPNNTRAVTVVGFVRAVKPGGTEGESCNCRAKGDTQVDTHIELVLDPNNQSNAGHGMVVAEVQERVRRVAAKGLLQSNIGNDWSTPVLQSRLVGQWVKVSGWLFYDPDHHLETWQVDPHDTLGKKNWRETGWEVHPVLALETGVQPPPDAGSGGTPPPPASGEVHGNRRSHVYHLPGCPGYNSMSPANLVSFATETAAMHTGYRKAQNCR